MSDEIGFVAVLPRDGTDGRWALRRSRSARGSGSTTRSSASSRRLPRRSGFSREAAAWTGSPRRCFARRRSTSRRRTPPPGSLPTRGRGRTRRCRDACRNVTPRFGAIRTRVRDWCVQASTRGMNHPLKSVARAVRGPRRRAAGERERQQAPRPARAARASPRSRRRRRRADRRLVGRRPACRAAQRRPAPRRSSSGCARPGDDRRLARRLRADRRSRRRAAVRGAVRRGAKRSARAMPARRPRRWHPRWSSGAALHCTGSPKLPWFSAEARRLESLRVDALEEQFEAALALGDHREIVLRFARRSTRTRSASGCGGS